MAEDPRGAAPCFSTSAGCSEEFVVWNFVVAELESARWGPRLRPRLEPSLLDRVRSGDFGTLSSEELRSLKTALLGHRGRFAELLLRPRTTWTVGRLRFDCLPKLRVIGEPDFVDRAPSRLLGEFAEATARGEPPIRDFDEGFARLRSVFRIDRIRGLPIMVAEKEVGPYTIAEGLTRICCLQLAGKSGVSRPESIAVILGVDPGLSRWPWL